MIEAILMVAVFAGCLWVAYLCLRHVFGVSTAAAKSSPAPRDKATRTPNR